MNVSIRETTVTEELLYCFYQYFETFKVPIRLFESKKSLAAVTLLLPAFTSWAQDGNAGINQATTQVKSYFATGTNLMYAIGAIVGLVGAIKVYKKWMAVRFTNS